MKLTTHLHPVLRFRVSEATPLLPMICCHVVDIDSITFLYLGLLQ
jgi:hypothetical protein